ncbi:MAG: DUF6456 domain-containing protein [Alphaproteobacteria bacterium]|nr:DUF6456 domain-containing protein [Alphaproteobacteria bacterium]
MTGPAGVLAEAGAEDAALDGEARRALDEEARRALDEKARRAARMLQVSGRRLMCLGAEWGVLAGGDRRTRPMTRLSAGSAARLIASGVVKRAPGGGFVLAEAAGREHAPETGPGIFIVAGAPRSRRRGVGFQGLAQRALVGEGPLSLRQMRAGVRLIADAEASLRSRGLTMNWDAAPVDRVRRGGGTGGLGAPAREAARRIARLRSEVGDGLMDLAWAACVQGCPLGALERRHGLAARSGSARLALALERLAAAYDG